MRVRLIHQNFPGQCRRIGQLVNFFAPKAIAEEVVVALKHPANVSRMRMSAWQAVMTDMG